MLIEGRVHKTIDLEDLNSLVSFKQWLSKNIFPPNANISSRHIDLALGFLENQISEYNPENKSEWKDRIEHLGSRNSKDGR